MFSSYVHGYILFMNCVFIIINMVSRPKSCVETNNVGLTSIKYTQSTFPGVLTHLGVLWCKVHFLKKTSNYEFQEHTPM